MYLILLHQLCCLRETLLEAQQTANDPATSMALLYSCIDMNTTSRGAGQLEVY